MALRRSLRFGEIGLSETCMLEAGSVSCSGIIIDTHRGYIITHASLLLHYMDSNADIYNQLLYFKKLHGTSLKNWPIQVTCEFVHFSSATNNEGPVASLSYSSTNLPVSNRRVDISTGNILQQRGSNSSQLKKEAAYVQAVWRSDRFAKSLANLFPESDSWKFYAESQSSPKSMNVIGDKDDKLSKIHKTKDDVRTERVTQLLPYFVLVKLIDNSYISSHTFVNPIVDYIADAQRENMIDTGDPVFVVGTPFGNLSPAIFINSVSKGIVSNIAGDYQEVILTDARCIPGTEGGAIYKMNPSNLYQHNFHNRSSSSYTNNLVSGIVVAPLCWRSNEWVGMSVGCRFSEVLKPLQEIFNMLHKSESGRFFSDIRNVSVITEVAQDHRHHEIVNAEVSKTSSFKDVHNIPVVLVQNQGTWGSGLIIHQGMGLVITCSHVVTHAKTVQVRIGAPSFTWFTGDVIYATPDGEVFDIAVLQLQDYKCQTNWQTISKLAANTVAGDEAFVLGHAAFGREHNMGPCITAGIVSKIVYYFKSPVLIQTTCAVHAGASGGPLINTDGKLLGIIVCNAKDVDSGATYPHINLSVPSCAFWPGIMTYIKSRNTKHLHAIHVNHLKIKQLWSLSASVNGGKMSMLKSKL